MKNNIISIRNSFIIKRKNNKSVGVLTLIWQLKHQTWLKIIIIKDRNFIKEGLKLSSNTSIKKWNQMLKNIKWILLMMKKHSWLWCRKMNLLIIIGGQNLWLERILQIFKQAHWHTTTSTQTSNQNSKIFVKNNRKTKVHFNNCSKNNKITILIWASSFQDLYEMVKLNQKTRLAQINSTVSVKKTSLTLVNDF